MEELIQGTSTSMIKSWIFEMKKDIQENNFYCVKKHDDLWVSRVNKARLSVMNSIFHVSENDYSEGCWRGVSTGIASAEKNQKLMLNYLETFELLIKL